MSDIEWTDTTWNPVIGCELASPGCAICYAATMAKRQVGMAQGHGRVSHYADVVHIDEPGGKKRRGAGIWNGQTRFLPERLGEPLKWRKPRMVFAPSMSDFFHPSVSFYDVAAILGVMAVTPRHTYQVLTKRPARLLKFLRWLRHSAPMALGTGCVLGRSLVAALNVAINSLRRDAQTAAQREHTERLIAAQTRLAVAVEAGTSLPLPNVWFGVSVEDQKRADERLPLLATVRAMGWHTFVSAEPLIGAISDEQSRTTLGVSFWEAAEWVIVGGESGPMARECNGAWVRRVIADASRAGCAVFVKQLGAKFADDYTGVYGAATPDEHMHGVRLTSRKGSKPDEWPAFFQRREWPAAMGPGR